MATGQMGGHVITTFKFKWIDEDGDEAGFLRKKGSFDGSSLKLDDAEIPAENIVDLETRDNRIILSIHTGEAEPAVFAFAVSGVASKRLKGIIDVARSASWARIEREELEAKGEGHLYREANCQHCTAVITLSRMEDSPQLYCSFCDTLTTIKNPQTAPPGEKSLKICEECGMFSKPTKFTIFYFYFLLVIYGFRKSTTWRCPGCMRGEAWKMLFGNLVFLLGVPTAIIQLIRSYGGSVTGKFAGLDSANIKARKGKSTAALAQYREILKRVPHSAGLKYNIGLGLLEQKPELATESFEMALRDCSNYRPAAGLLVHCYEKSGADDKLAQLHYIWGSDQDKAKDESSSTTPPPIPEQ